MLSEDLESVNLRHEIYMYVCMCGMCIIFVVLVIVCILFCAEEKKKK